MKILGVDTVEFGIDFSNYDIDFFEFLYKLDTLKNLSQKTLKDEVININGINFTVNRKGQGFYRYKIECLDFSICFMQRDMKTNPPVYVRFMSQFLWTYGYEECYKKFTEWFSIFNVRILGNRLSRLDICFDTEEIEFKPHDKDFFVTRARKIDTHYIEEPVYIDSEHHIGKSFSGFVIGRGSPLSCRIYNKSLEVKNSKTWFHTIWREYNYNEFKTVWRVEFQCRRPVLKELQLNSYEDINRNLSHIWAYFTQKWLVLKTKNNNNVSRCSVLKKWKIVQSGGKNYETSPAIRHDIRYGKVAPLLQQMSRNFFINCSTQQYIGNWYRINDITIYKN